MKSLKALILEVEQKRHPWIEPDYVHPGHKDYELLPLALDDRNITGHIQNYANCTIGIAQYISPDNDPRNLRGLIDRNGLVHCGAEDLMTVDDRKFLPVCLFSSYYQKYIENGSEDYQDASRRARLFIDELDAFVKAFNSSMPSLKSGDKDSKGSAIEAAAGILSMICRCYSKPNQKAESMDCDALLKMMKDYHKGPGILVRKNNGYRLLQDMEAVKKHNKNLISRTA